MISVVHQTLHPPNILSEFKMKNLEAYADASSASTETGIDDLALQRSERVAQPNGHAVSVACRQLFLLQKHFFYGQFSPE